MPPTDSPSPPPAPAGGRGTAVTLIGCGGTKLDRPAAAADLYTSTLFGKSRAWAEAEPGRWYIASAKHHLLRPDTVIAPYDTRLGAGHDAPPIHAWAARLIAELTAAEPDLAELTVLAGQTYVTPLRWQLAGTEVTLHDPLRGLGVGQRLAWLTAHTRA